MENNDEKLEELTLKKQKITTHNLRKILPYYAKSKGKLAALMIAMLCTGVLGILNPIYSANALASLATGDFEKATKLAIIMCILALGRIIFNAFVELLYTRINAQTRAEITKTVINSINQTKMSKLDSTKLGFLAERMSSDVGSVSDTYLDMMNLVFDILTNFVFLVYIAYLNIYLFLILLCYVVVLYFVCTIRSRIWIRGRKIVKKANDEARSAYYEQINGVRDVKLLNIKSSVTDYSNQKYKNAVGLEIKIGDKRNLMRRVQSSISTIFELVFLLVGIAMVNKEMIMLAGLLVIYTYYGRVEWLVNYLSQYKEYKSDGEIAATRIFEVIEDYEKESFGTDEIEDFSGTIELSDVHFAYKDGSEVLKGLNMKFEPNKMTAIVGKSGSGKTTILNLLSKLYDVSSGKILLDDKDINDLTENSIRSNIGEISQAPYIFNCSIRQNLLFAKPDATESEMIAVLKDAQIWNDISKMEKGIDTEVGENGVKVSGGQKQRLAIARLLLKNSKVIVFDEATSALDNESQKKIVDLLDTLKKDKTIIIVAHRLSTIVESDNIYMIDDGKVIASGTHASLMKNCAAYNELYSLEEESSTVSE
jgi:ABC-type multidrug transport system fused ATPase/permease subunit